MTSLTPLNRDDINNATDRFKQQTRFLRRERAPFQAQKNHVETDLFFNTKENLQEFYKYARAEVGLGMLGIGVGIIYEAPVLLLIGGVCLTLPLFQICAGITPD